MVKFPHVILAVSLSLSVSLWGCSQDMVSQQSSSSNTVRENSNDAVVNVPPSQTPSSSELWVLSSGEFIDGEHPTQGTVKIIPRRKSEK